MIQSIQKELGQSGFDLCHPIHTSWYNNLIKDEGLVEDGTLDMLPEPYAISDEKGGSTYNALLIGNSKRIWPVFLKWLESKVQRSRKENRNFADEEVLENVISPFDTCVDELIRQALERCFEGGSELTSYELFWSNGKRQKVNTNELNDFVTSDGPIAKNNYHFHCYDDEEHSFLVSMQRVAKTTGRYWNDDEATKLCIHPEYGTWMAFRAVVVLETKRYPRCSISPVPPPCPCPASDEEIKMAKTVFDHALKMSSSDERGYGATLNKSWEELCEYLHSKVCSGSKWEDVPDNMKPWIQLRDCISVGREKWKYSDAQLLYHYTKDREILKTELERIRTQGEG